MKRKLILITTIFILISCRKDNTYAPFLGNYYFTKHEWSYCSGCPPEANQDTTYNYLGTITKGDSNLIIIDGYGFCKFNPITKLLGSTNVAAYSYSGAPHGKFFLDTAMELKASDSYWGHSWGWTLYGKKL